MLNWLKSVNAFFEGKRTIIAALGAAIVATGTIIAKFAADTGGINYLMGIASTPEFAAASLGWVGFFAALKGETIKKKIDELPGAVKDVPPVP